MEKKLDTADKTIRPWSRDKLELLAKYLHAYTTIMKRQKARWLRSYSYIDAFASVGQYADPDSQEYVDGSPVVALRCDPPFDDFWFIELSADRLQSLRQRVESDFPDRCVYFRQGDANTILQQEVARRITYASGRRGFVFLDPYGLEVDFKTVEFLSKTKALDLFINFSVMGVTRMLDRHDSPDPRTTARLNRVMGNIGWTDEIYVKQPTLFGDEHSYRGRLDPHRLADRYCTELRQLFPHVSEPVLMRNSRGAPLYALLLASHNKTAVRITNDIFRNYERLRAQPRQ
ncbi:MAG: three-Cys-motif partner protein TcmP [Chloroflexi bacterium]|nr:three-Cys-motif partner protein TcmP [Chloroflexota bacterium]